MRLRYYCKGTGNPKIHRLLETIQDSHAIPFEVIDLSTGGQEAERKAYERDFKPRARLLRRRTGGSIQALRSRRARNYFVSTPGTVAIVKDNQVEWFALGDDEVLRFLEEVVARGPTPVTSRCR